MKFCMILFMLTLIYSYYDGNILNYKIYVSQLRAGGPVIPGLSSSGQGQAWSEHEPGHSGNPVYYGDEYYFYFMGRHTRASPKGGRSCSLCTLNYLIASHLAFRLNKRKTGPASGARTPNPGCGYPEGLWHNRKITKQIAYLNSKISKGSQNGSGERAVQ